MESWVKIKYVSQRGDVNLFIYSSITKESIIDVEGVIQGVAEKITSASQQDVEIHADKVKCCLSL